LGREANACRARYARDPRPRGADPVHQLITQATLHPLFTATPVVALALIGWAAIRSRRQRR